MLRQRLAGGSGAGSFHFVCFFSAIAAEQNVLISGVVCFCVCGGVCVFLRQIR